MHALNWVEINLSRLDANVAWWRALLAPARLDQPAPRLCAVVKADAYGLGAVPIAQRLAAAGVDMLAVYSPAQAEELLNTSTDLACPILVLMPMRPLEDSAPVRTALAEGRLHLAVNDQAQFELARQQARAAGVPLPVHLHLDTGMCRAGLSLTQFAGLLGRLRDDDALRLAGICSHLATPSDGLDFAHQQRLRLERALDQHRDLIPPGTVVHLGATFAALRDRRFHRDMVRIGIGLYGHGPDLLAGLPGDTILDPAQGAPAPIYRWLSRLVHVQSYPKGAPVGYSASHVLARDSVLGLVPAGYADGYPLELSNRAVVRLTDPACGPEAHAPVIGKVSMDQIIIDLTDAPGARPGQLVELISGDPASPCSLPRLASLARTTPYEMLCRLSSRLPHKYVSVEVVRPALTGRLATQNAG